MEWLAWNGIMGYAEWNGMELEARKGILTNTGLNRIGSTVWNNM